MENSSAVLTFAIPFYSTPEYLKLAIESVIRQTRTDWKLIVVDDCSPIPGIRDLVEGFKDNRISYSLNPQNLGQAGNWNRCLELAQTDLVTLLHADDELEPDYAEKMVGVMEKGPGAAAAFCRARIIDENGREIFSFVDHYKKFLMQSTTEIFSLKGEDGLSALIKGNFIMCPTLCYRRSRLGGQVFSRDWKCTPDMDYTTRLLLSGAELISVPEVCFRYRRHGESGTAHTQRSLRMFEEEVALYKKLASDSASLGWRKSERLAQRKKILKLRVGFAFAKDLAAFDITGALRKGGYLGRLIFGRA